MCDNEDNSTGQIPILGRLHDAEDNNLSSVRSQDPDLRLTHLPAQSTCNGLQPGSDKFGVEHRTLVGPAAFS